MHQPTSNDVPCVDNTGPARTLSDLLGMGRKLLRRVEVLITLAVACALVIPATRDIPYAPLEGPIVWIALAVILLCMHVTFRSIRLYVSSDSSRLASLADDAHRSGASLVARSVRHSVGNKLAVTVGYSELLLDDPRLPNDVHEHAELIFNSALAAAESVHKLDTSLLDLKPDTGLAGPTVLDLTAREPVGVSGPELPKTSPAVSTPQARRDADSTDWTRR